MLLNLLLQRPLIRRTLKIGTISLRILNKENFYTNQWGIKTYSNDCPTDSQTPRLDIPPTARIIRDDPNATVVLLGTVHFSKKSVDDVSQVVNVLNPNAIMVELCRSRVSLLELDDKKFLEDAKNFNPQKIREAVKGQDFVSGTLHAILLKSYADVANELGVAPGGEFRRAYQEMKRIPGCKLFLGDRPIQITMARAFRSLNIFELGQLMFHLSSTKPKPVGKDSIEKYKEREYVDDQMRQVLQDFPAFSKIFTVFVDERDKCLAFSLQECVNAANILNAVNEDKARVLAVVGMGHVTGIVKYYGHMKATDILPLLSIPRPPLINRIIGTTLKFTFYFLIFSILYKIIW